jgi:hypothetical protein
MQDNHRVTLCKLFNVYSMWNSKTDCVTLKLLGYYPAIHFEVLFKFRYFIHFSIHHATPYIISHPSYIAVSTGHKFFFFFKFLMFGGMMPLFLFIFHIFYYIHSYIHIHTIHSSIAIR